MSHKPQTKKDETINENTTEKSTELSKPATLDSSGRMAKAWVRFFKFHHYLHNSSLIFVIHH